MLYCLEFSYEYKMKLLERSMTKTVSTSYSNMQSDHDNSPLSVKKTLSIFSIGQLQIISLRYYLVRYYDF